MEKILVVIFLLGAILLLSKSLRQRIRSRSRFIDFTHYSEKVKEVNSNVIQISPQYHGYHGGFTSITTCEICRRTALREDQHPAEPCPECGGKVRDSGAAKWDGNRWVKAKSNA